MKIEIATPAPQKLADTLHRNLVESGQALDDDAMETFVLRVEDEQGRMTAGCKGEIAFRSAHVSELWVDASLRGQGIGGALLNRAEEYAKQNDCTRLHLETRNEGARRLYERLGYAVFGKLPDYDGDTPFYYLTKSL